MNNTELREWVNINPDSDIAKAYKMGWADGMKDKALELSPSFVLWMQGMPMDWLD